MSIILPKLESFIFFCPFPVPFPDSGFRIRGSGFRIADSCFSMRPLMTLSLSDAIL